MYVTGGTRCPQRVGRKTCGPAARYLRLRRLTSSSEKPIHVVSAVKQCSEPSRCMELQTPRLTLRSFREEDVDAMAQLFANPDFMRFSLGVFTKREQTIAFIEKVMGWDRAGIPSQFAVVPRGDDALIGYCGFFYHPEHGIEDIEIGYRLNPDYWNRGLITEAARAVRDHGFRDRKLSRVISLIHPENIPSRRVAEKNGMTIEKQITFRGFPTLVYAMTREEWVPMRGVS
jgi:[ribosomal protein S5]-alanine N-acetyltransferase